ncbi:MAG: hypothetical protein ABH812_00230 [bacterium]
MLWRIIFWIWKNFVRIDNKWFFKDLSGYSKNIFLVFVKGDLLLLLPLLFAILLLGFFSTRLMLVLLGSYIAVRYFTEIIYWLLQQFGSRQYRPYDFGFKKLKNEAIYIIYQTIAISWTMFGLAILFYALLFLK